MTIQIYGAGCSKCKILEEQAIKAVDNLNIDAQVEKIEDIDEIMNAGVMITPALGIDGVVKTRGKVLSEKDIEKLIQGEMS